MATNDKFAKKSNWQAAQEIEWTQFSPEIQSAVMKTLLYSFIGPQILEDEKKFIDEQLAVLLKDSKETVAGEPGWQSYAPATPDGWLPIVGIDDLRITLRDGTVIDLTGSDGIKSGTAAILGFSKSRR